MVRFHHRQNRILEIVRPPDALICALLAAAVIWILAAWRPALAGTLALHATLLGGYAGLLAAAYRWPGSLFVALRLPAGILAIALLYSSLGQLGFQLHAQTWDPQLAAADETLFGAHPALFLERWNLPYLVNFMSAVYVGFIIYVYLSIIVHCAGRDRSQWEEFFTGLTIVYTLGYLGYLLFPARGPAAYLASRFGAPLADGIATRLMNAMVHSAGGAIGAFPSLHIGGALYLILHDRHEDRLRYSTYLVWIPLVAISTVFLRHHYVVDWIGGIAIAALGLRLRSPIIAGWRSLEQPEVLRCSA
jgi:hypothetical protein